MTGLIQSAGQFIARVRSHPDAPAGGLLAPGVETIIARAPGRLDLMGGIADYSGSLVLQWPIQEATWAALQPVCDGKPSLAVTSLGSEPYHEGGESGRTVSYTLPLAALTARNGTSPAEYAALRDRLAENSASHWASYVLGAFLVLMRERGARFTGGMRLVIASDVPEGKGVSSSAAIEVAAMQAAAAVSGIALSPRELGLLCQIVENRVVGAPCGVMDQMTSACGAEGALMALRCQPAELLGNVPLPEGLAVWGIDSGVRHSVSGADYGTVRAAAFMGLRMIEQADGIDLSGYLSRLAPSEFEQHYARLLPGSITGAEFAARYGDMGDPLSVVLPERAYPVLAATAHPIYENLRVRVFGELLNAAGAVEDERGALLGELMYQSHASYSACGLGSAATDRLVAMVRESGPESGLLGAKITGGGSGGTVAVLARRGADQAIGELASRYFAATAYQPYVFTGSSQGAAAYGVERVAL